MPQMLDHLGIQCRDVAAAAAFYDVALATLGAKRIMDFGQYIGYGVDKPDFGAFVRDPDGNNVEAVCHRPE